MDAQELYWSVSGRYATALMAMAEADPVESATVEGELIAATDALDAFRRDHAGQTFKAFDPRWIREAFVEVA